MADPLGARELQEIEERAARATPGPWEDHSWDAMERPHVVKPPVVGERWECRGSHDMPLTSADAAFIAHAREDIDRLLATIRSLQQPVTVSDDDVRACLDEFNDCAEMNSPETNMRAALETFAYRNSAPDETTLETMTSAEAKAALRSLGLEGATLTLNQRNAQGEKLQ